MVLKIEEQNLSGYKDYDNHQLVIRAEDLSIDFKAFIAVHNTNLGPALGGCRFYSYKSEADAITDALRLSKGMTYKNAISGLALGGGKGVIIAPPQTTSELKIAFMRAFGRTVESLKGTYITAE